jgi:putative ABC transport system substrate-binding protein
LFFIRRRHIADLALQRAIPTAFDDRAYVSAGGLLCYGADFLNVMELAGNYAGLILKGAKPGDLPVQQPTKFEMVINLRTAKALEIEVPQTLLLLADELIE